MRQTETDNDDDKDAITILKVVCFTNSRRTINKDKNH